MASTRDDHRRRLLDGMAEAITAKGYAATTISDVVRHARVSKRTFYEHFADKQQAFLATYSQASDDMLAVIAEAMAIEAPWRDRVAAGMRAYLSELSSHPTLTRTFVVEIQAAGPEALALRRDVMRRFADTLRAMTAEVARGDASVRPLTDPLATAVVGGINELLLRAVEEGHAGELADLTDDAIAFLFAVVERR